jgi:thiosulfate dehydrogenase
MVRSQRLHCVARRADAAWQRSQGGGMMWLIDSTPFPAARSAVAALWLLLAGITAGVAQAPPSTQPIWTVPEIGALPDDANARQVRRGRDLVTATYAHIGPEVADPALRFAGNNLACSNCHLDAGTKKFGIPLFGLFGEYPRYSVRLGAEISIEDRLNSCMTRSMNGRPLPADAAPMQALVAYIRFLSTGVPPGRMLPGLGVGKMPELDRAADPGRGETIYTARCGFCHGADGSGVRRSLPTTDLGYMIPPLWGGDSFNDGAGMARLITAANFVHFNMPHGADYLDPQLAPADAWDVAAYMVAQPRPHKGGLDRDFPDLREKPGMSRPLLN